MRLSMETFASRSNPLLENFWAPPQSVNFACILLIWFCVHDHPFVMDA